MAFTVSKNGRLALLNVATQVSLLHHQFYLFAYFCQTNAIPTERRSKNFMGVFFFFFWGELFKGSPPVGSSRSGAGAEVPRCDPGLLHHPLLLWRAQWRLYCQWQRRYGRVAKYQNCGNKKKTVNVFEAWEHKYLAALINFGSFFSVVIFGTVTWQTVLNHHWLLFKITAWHKFVFIDWRFKAVSEQL